MKSTKERLSTILEHEEGRKKVSMVKTTKRWMKKVKTQKIRVDEVKEEEMVKDEGEKGDE